MNGVGKMNLKIKTPIWTGDIDSKSDLLQSSGIMGSLRWWTEAILRGLGKFACDPVGDDRDRCPLKNNKEIDQYCSACLIFGATGMRRTFKLHLKGGKRIFSGRSIEMIPNGRNRGWYLGSGLIGEMNFDVISLDKDFNANLTLIPLTIISKWGAIGAKTQLGYGVVEFEDYPKFDFSQFKESLDKITNENRLSHLKIEERNGSNDNLPNLKDMFFAKVRFEADNNWWKKVDGIRERGEKGDRNYYEGYVNDPRLVKWMNAGSAPIVPALKNWLRFGSGKSLWETGDSNKDRRIENWLLGTIRNGKSASKINISCAYRVDNSLWEFRIWGWVPKNNPPNGFNRDDFLNELRASLAGNGSVKIPWDNLLGRKAKEYKLKVWREFNSPRDTVKPNESIIDDYLQSLINGGEEGQ